MEQKLARMEASYKAEIEALKAVSSCAGGVVGLFGLTAWGVLLHVGTHLA